MFCINFYLILFNNSGNDFLIIRLEDSNPEIRS